jgi:integrase
MPRKKYKLTKLKDRWRKRYKGRSLYFSFKKYPTAREAWEAFLIKKAEIDLELQKNKPHQNEYNKAITDRQALAQYCREQGEYSKAEILDEEAEALLTRFNNSVSPKPLNSEEADPLSPIMSLFEAEIDIDVRTSNSVIQLKEEEEKSPQAFFQNIKDELGLKPKKQIIEEERRIWNDRIKRTKNSRPNEGKTVGENIDSFLARKKAKANLGQLSQGYLGVLHAHLHRFKKWIGAGFLIEEISSKTLADYHSFLLSEATEQKISLEYAKDNMKSVKYFVRSCWELELCDLPRNINSRELAIESVKQKIVTFSDEEIQTLLIGASERTRLYILLALNCGFTQADIASLKQSEVNWKKGVITRKRSKTEKHENVPVVSYPLWPETSKLLKKHRSKDPELVLLNERGKPLLQESNDGGNYHKTDNIKKAFERLCKKVKIKAKTFKHFRKTGSTKLGEHKIHKGYIGLYLGHSPKSIADIHYAEHSKELFNEAVQWLGEQFGFRKT